MRVVAPEPVRSYIERQGGRLYVWPKANRCCGGSRLRAAVTPPGRIEFTQRDDEDGFALFLPAAIARVPEELQLALKRRPLRVEAYWNGCAWIV